MERCAITFLFCFILIIFIFYHRSRLSANTYNMNAQCYHATKPHEIESELKRQPNAVAQFLSPQETGQNRRRSDATKTNSQIFTRPQGCCVISLRQQLFLWGYDLVLGSKHQQPGGSCSPSPNNVELSAQQNKYIREPEHQCLWR